MLLSAVLVSLAIPNELLLLGSPYIALISLIPFYIAISRCTSYREAFWLSALQITAVHLISSFWLAFFKDFAIFTLGGSALGTGFIGGTFGILFYMPFAQENGRSRLAELSGSSTIRIPLRIFWFAGAYTVYEWVKSTGFLAYPWGTLSSTSFRWQLLMQIADLTGTYGITFLFALFSAICAEGYNISGRIVFSPFPRNMLAAYKKTAETGIILFTAAFIYGAFQYAYPRRMEKALNTVMVQQNFNPWNSTNDNDTVLLSEHLTEQKIGEFTRKGLHPDLVIWSEGVLQYAFPNAAGHYTQFPTEEPLSSFISRMNTPFVIGGSFLADPVHRSFNNAALLFDNTGTFRGSYGKLHLVPFAEVIPGIEYPWVKHLMQKVVGISAGWLAGDQFVYFDIPGSITPDCKKPDVRIIPLDKSYMQQSEDENKRPVVRISTPICFDDAFPSDVCRPLFLNGSEVFMNITDDSWSLTRSAEYQHYIIASYRAIEFRTTLVRSTNAGVSAVLDPCARELSSAPLFAEAAQAVTVPVFKRTMTAYALFGNWLPCLLSILIVSYASYAFSVRNKPFDVRGERDLSKKTKKHAGKEKKNRKDHERNKKDKTNILSTY